LLWTPLCATLVAGLLLLPGPAARDATTKAITGAPGVSSVLDRIKEIPYLSFQEKSWPCQVDTFVHPQMSEPQRFALRRIGWEGPVPKLFCDVSGVVQPRAEHNLDELNAVTHGVDRGLGIDSERYEQLNWLYLGVEGHNTAFHLDRRRFGRSFAIYLGAALGFAATLIGVISRRATMIGAVIALLATSLSEAFL